MKSWASGSLGAISGAKIATTTQISTTVRPTMASGCRHGDDDFRAPSAAGQPTTVVGVKQRARWPVPYHDSLIRGSMTPYSTSTSRFITM